ncbi:MAG TPA: MFS transporter [Planctomycetes bacterium]|nr:MFS transporter [Planctomycetota bacterium]
MSETRPKEPLHPTVKATGWVSFFTDMGSELIYAVLPFLIIDSIKASRAFLGLIEGLAEATPAFLRLVAGTLSDRARNRVWLIFSGYLASTAVKPFIALAFSQWHVLLLRFLDRIGKGIRSAPRDALVADLAPGPQRGRAFGFQRAMDHMGAVLGGVSAFVLLNWLGLSIAWAIAASAIPGIASVLVIALFVRDVPGRAARISAPRPPLEGLRALPRVYYAYLAAAALFALANSSDVFLLLRARDMGIAVQIVPLLWALLHVVKTAASYVCGGLSDRVGRKPVLVSGWILYGLVYIAFGFMQSAGAAWALFALYGVFFGATEGVAKAFVADLVPAEKRGTAFGLLGMAEGLLVLPASLLCGALWDATSTAKLSLVLGGAFALAAALVLLALVRAPRGNRP